MLSVTFVADTAYCTKYAYLLHVRRIPPHREVFLGSLRHKCYEQINLFERSAGLKDLPKKQVEARIKEAIAKTVEAHEQSLFVAGYSLAQARDEVERAFRQKIKDTAKQIASSAPPPKTLSEKTLKSERLGVRGRVDKIVFSDTIYPVEFKGWSKRLERDSVQLAAYGLLIEETYDTRVPRGVIEYLQREVEVPLTQELRSKFLDCKKAAEAIKLGFVPSCNCKSCEKECHYRQAAIF